MASPPRLGTEYIRSAVVVLSLGCVASQKCFRNGQDMMSFEFVLRISLCVLRGREEGDEREIVVDSVLQITQAGS